jgi:hypothetical protein
MNNMNPGSGIVYTETVVHAAPEQFVADAPYQLAIVTLDGGKRLTGRIISDRVVIGDRVDFVEERAGIPFFRKVAGDSASEDLIEDRWVGEDGEPVIRHQQDKPE